MDLKNIFSRKALIVFTIFSLQIQFIFSQIQPTIQDCWGALPICQTYYYIEDPAPFFGEGNYDEEFTRFKDCVSPENSGFWYSFTAQNSGYLRFTIEPDILSQDYDWTVFDVTGADCNDLKNSTRDYVVSSNSHGNLSGIDIWGYVGLRSINGEMYLVYGNDSVTFDIDSKDAWVNNSGYVYHVDLTQNSYRIFYSLGPLEIWVDQTTGANSSHSDAFGICNNPGFENSNAYNEDIYVRKGRTYMIYISNVYDGTGGFKFDLRESDPGIFDDSPPYIMNTLSTPECGQKEIEIFFNELVDCSSVDASDFKVTGEGKTFNVTSVYSYACNYLSAERGQSFILILDEQLQSGAYQVELVGDVYDACGNVSDGGKYNFTVNGINYIGNVNVKAVSPCHGDNNGRITVFARGYKNLYYYVSGRDEPQLNSGIFTDLPGGTYTIHVENEFGCKTNPVTTKVGEPKPIKISTPDYSEMINCNSGEDGYISLSASGGGGSFRYSINGGVTWRYTDGNFTDLSAGNYQVTVRDGNKCVVSGELLTIDEPEPVEAKVTSKNSGACAGDNSGQIIIQADGGNPGYFYSINDGETFQLKNLFTGLSPDTYTVKTKDAHSCNAPDTTITIIEPEPIEIYDYYSEPVGTCYGDSTAYIKLFAKGGTEPLSYSIDNGKTYNDNEGLFQNLPAGDYSIRISDFQGCHSGKTSIQITQPELLSIDSVKFNNATTCFESSDGYISIFASGGTDSIFYSIDGQKTFQDTAFFDMLPSGTYPIAVKDVNGCITVGDTVYINAPEKVEIIDVEKTDVKCFGYSDGAIAIHSNDTLGLYKYSIDGGKHFYINSGYFKNLSPGKYFPVLKNKNNCRRDHDSIMINQPDSLLIDSVKIDNVTTCYYDSTGIIQIHPSGGNGYYSFSLYSDTLLENKTGHFTQLPRDEYTVAVTDTFGCTVSLDTLNVTSPPKLIIDSVALSDISCFNYDDAAIEVFEEGGTPPYTYDIGVEELVEDTSNTFIDLYANKKYVPKVIDSFQCIAVGDTISFDNPPDIEFLNIEPEHINTCFGDSTGKIRVNAIGGTGQYYYTINNLRGDISSEGVFDMLHSGNYTVSVHDENGCSLISDTIFIMQPLPVQIDSINYSNNLCKSDSTGLLDIFASGGHGIFEYSLDSGQTYSAGQNKFFDLNEGKFIVFAKDTAGCLSDSISVTLTAPDSLKLSIRKMTQPLCYGIPTGQIQLQASGGVEPYVFFLDDSLGQQNLTGFFDSLPEKDYQPYVLDANNCKSIFSQEIAMLRWPDSLYIEKIGKTDVETCFGDSTAQIIATAKGGVGEYNYSLQGEISENNNNGLFQQLFAGKYVIHVQDSNNCQYSSDSLTIQQPDKMFPDFIDTISVSCRGLADGNISVSFFNNEREKKYYLFSPDTVFKNDSGRFENLLPGYYSLKIQDNFNCVTVLDSLEIRQPDIDIKSVDIRNVLCYGDNNGAIHIVPYFPGGGEFVYNWSNGEDDAELNNLGPGVYSLRLTELQTGECVVDSFFIHEPEPLEATFTAQNASCFWLNDGKIDMSINGGTGYYNFLCEDQSGKYQLFLDSLKYGEYYLTVEDDNSCMLYDTILISYNDCLLESFYVPNIFTPDGNGINDYFKVNYEPKNIKYFKWFHAEIYTQWGRKIYEWDGEDNYWDGKVQNGNKLAAPGVYFYIIQYEGMDGRVKVAKGHVNLFSRKN